ncbi:MAG: nucleotidyltransferase family protein [Mariniphaga sp.]
MNYKEALFFIGKCLTLGHYPEKTDEIRKVIHSGSVIWEQVVWASTDQLVFTALHLQLKRAGLLPELPTDLVEYMEEFTSLNRERNNLIIAQANEISGLLNRHGIIPIFLKGTGHLLDGLYDDIGERQVGDIDILIRESDLSVAGEVLIREGYVPVIKFDPNGQKVIRHYPRLQNNERTAAVELHFQIIILSFYKPMDMGLIFKNSRMLHLPNQAAVMSNAHQIVYNILNVQILDNGYYYAKVFLRQIYDLLMLSERKNPLDAIKGFGKCFDQMNSDLALSDQILDHPGKISFQSDWRVRLFLFRVTFKLDHPRWARFSNGLIYVWLRFVLYANYVIRSIYDSKVRSFFYKRICHPEWYVGHLKQ